MAGDGEGVGHQADEVQRQHEHEDREHEGEEPHAFVTGGRAHGRGDEFVGYFRGRLQARRHQALFGGADHQEGGDDDHRGQHESRRIGEHDIGAADMCDREQFDDAELMNWIGGHGLIRALFRSNRSVCSRTTPAARITLRTPAAKPSNRNTISPHGEIPSQRSSSQPISRAHEHACDQFGRHPKPAGIRRRIGGRTRAIHVFGMSVRSCEPVAETLEPRGESSLVVRQFFAITFAHACRQPCFRPA